VLKNALKNVFVWWATDQLVSSPVNGTGRDLNSTT